MQAVKKAVKHGEGQMSETQYSVSRAENFTITFYNSSLISLLKNELRSSSLINIHFLYNHY